MRRSFTQSLNNRMVNELDEQVTSANQTMALVMERLDAILGQKGN
jgi:hypothetical protein